MVCRLAAELVLPVVYARLAITMALNAPPVRRVLTRRKARYHIVSSDAGAVVNPRVQFELMN